MSSFIETPRSSAADSKRFRIRAGMRMRTAAERSGLRLRGGCGARSAVVVRAELDFDLDLVAVAVAMTETLVVSTDSSRRRHAARFTYRSPRNFRPFLPLPLPFLPLPFLGFSPVPAAVAASS